VYIREICENQICFRQNISHLLGNYSAFKCYRETTCWLRTFGEHAFKPVLLFLQATKGYLIAKRGFGGQ
jgi:hypothetical protein